MFTETDCIQDQKKSIRAGHCYDDNANQNMSAICTSENCFVYSYRDNSKKTKKFTLFFSDFLTINDSLVRLRF